MLEVGRILEEQYGFSVEQIPVDHEGFVLLPALEGAMGDDVLAVSIIAVNNEIGTIQDIESISYIVKRHGAIFHCDGAQAPTAIKMTLFGKYIDIITLSAHKMYGPKGVGLIYISSELQDKIEPLIYGGGQQNGVRSGTLPTPLCVGMGAAAILCAGDTAEEKRLLLRKRRDDFINRLGNLSWPIAVNGPSGHLRHPGNSSIQFVGYSAHDILGVLQPQLAASTGSACTSGISEPSHVLKAIGLGVNEAEASIRFSLGFETTDRDVQEAVSLIDSALILLSKAGLACSA